MCKEKEPEILGKEVIAATRFLELNQITYLNRFGDKRKWDMVSRVGGRRAVMIIPFYGEKIVLTREYRVPISGYEYSFPAGLIDDGEDPVTAARREIREETGLEITEILRTTQPLYNSPGLSDEAVTLVYARVEGTPSRSMLEADEDIETLILDKEQAAALIDNPENCFGAKAWIEVYHFCK